MNNGIKEEAIVDQNVLLQEAIKGAMGSNQSSFVTGTIPVEPNKTLITQDYTTNVPVQELSTPPMGQYETKDIDIPAVPQAELQQGPKPGTPRWNEVYAKAKKADKLEQELGGLRQTVEMLKQNMGGVAVSNISSELTTMQKAHEEALGNGDYARASQLNSRMMELTVKKQQMEANFGSALYAPTPVTQPGAPIAEAINQQYQAPQIPIEAQIAAATFEQNNPWYTADPGLNAAFNAYHQQTMNDYNWQERPIASQLNETLRRFKGAFPEKFRQQAPPAAVASVTPSAPAQPTQRIELTYEQKQAARMFSPPSVSQEAAEAEYLKQIMYYAQQGVKF